MTEEISKEKVQKMNQMLKDAVIEMEQKPERDHDFSFLEKENQTQESVMAKHLKRRVKPYTSSGIKTRNFLSNISYTGVKSEDFADNNFMFDTITLLTKNINPWNEKLLTQKIETLYICFGMSASKRHFTNTSVKMMILSI